MTADPDIAELLAARPWLRMDAMDGLTVDGVALNSIADALGTPTWVYSAHVLRARLAALRDALDVAGVAVGLHYAVKACDHLAVLRVVAAAGAGVDVVSGGELQRARAAGVPAGRIVFSGVGKTALEIRLAIGEGIGQINVESAEEIEAISAIAVSMGQIAPVALRINPDVDAKDARKNQHWPGARQVWHSVCAGSGALCADRRIARPAAGRAGDAHRQPNRVTRALS